MDYNQVAPQPVEMEGDFSSLNLSDISPKKKVRIPKRILHFSDGTLEEYSSEEEQEEEIQQSIIDPKTLKWAPWISFQTQHYGGKLLSACDYIGEGVANFLGITSPKFFYEIEDYKRAVKEEEEEKKEIEAQMAGWTSSPNHQPELVQNNEDDFMEKEFQTLKDLRGEPISMDTKIPLNISAIQEGDKSERY